MDLTDRSPMLIGEAGHYETKSGKPIRSVKAYKRRGWSNCYQVNSTRRIVIGTQWMDKVEKVLELIEEMCMLKLVQLMLIGLVQDEKDGTIGFDSG